jgi:tRNA 2-thiouridine synthesizing protein E
MFESLLVNSEVNWVPTIEVEGKVLELDEDGFLQDWEQWDEKVAEALAKDERFGDPIELTDEHWEII